MEKVLKFAEIHFTEFGSEKYEHVADFEVFVGPDETELSNSMLEMIYCALQNIDGSWSMGPEFEDGEKNIDYDARIRVHKPLYKEDGMIWGHKSMAMDDRIVFGNKTYEVKGIGFSEV